MERATRPTHMMIQPRRDTVSRRGSNWSSRRLGQCQSRSATQPSQFNPTVNGMREFDSRIFVLKRTSCAKIVWGGMNRSSDNGECWARSGLVKCRDACL